MVFASTAALPNYPTQQPITVTSGGTLGLGYGAASGSFTDANISAILGGGFSTTFAATGSSLGSQYFDSRWWRRHVHRNTLGSSQCFARI